MQEIVLQFIRDMFSFEKARYTTLDDLSCDIEKLAKKHIEVILEKLNTEPP